MLKYANFILLCSLCVKVLDAEQFLSDSIMYKYSCKVAPLYDVVDLYSCYWTVCCQPQAAALVDTASSVLHTHHTHIHSSSCNLLLICVGRPELRDGVMFRAYIEVFY